MSNLVNYHHLARLLQLQLGEVSAHCTVTQAARGASDFQVVEVDKGTE